MFDLQRFADEKAIPEELAGVSEDVARNIMAQAAGGENPAGNSPVDANDPNDVKVSYSRFKETLDQKADIERQLAAYREKFGDINAQPQSSPQQSYQPPQGYQPQQAQQQPPPVRKLLSVCKKKLTRAVFCVKLIAFSNQPHSEA